MVSDATQSKPPSRPALDDEAFCRHALRDDLPTLGLTLDELLRHARPERVAA